MYNFPPLITEEIHFIYGPNREYWPFIFSGIAMLTPIILAEVYSVNWNSVIDPDVKIPFDPYAGFGYDADDLELLNLRDVKRFPPTQGERIYAAKVTHTWKVVLD